MIRPEVVKTLRFLAEPIIWGAIALLFLWAAFSISGTAHWSIVAAPLLLAGVAGIGFWIAITRLKLHPSGAQKGVVLVDEQRVGFFDPDHEGGFVDLDALMRLEVRGALGDRSWVLYHEDGPPLMISQNAPGAEKLLDTFATLPQLSVAKFSRVFEVEGDDVQLLWERSPEFVHQPIH